MKFGELLAERYKPLKSLGHGGFGSTYLAEDLALERKVVVKVPHPGKEGWTLKEARAQASVNHANAVKIFDVVANGNRPFIVIEWIPGWTLATLIEKGGPLSSARAAQLFEAISKAVAHAHAMGIFHRDIKPHNILLGSDDIPRLADFGLAKLPSMPMTGEGIGMGTKGYAAPEQVSDSGKVDGRADIFSLGVTLLAMLSGNMFPTHDLIEQVAGTHGEFLRRCTAQQADRRYASVEAMLEELPDYEQAPARRLSLKEKVGTLDALKAIKKNKAEPCRKRDHVELIFNLGEVRLSGEGNKRTIVGYCHLPAKQTSAYVIRMHEKKNQYDVKRANKALVEYSPTIDFDHSVAGSLVDFEDLQ